MLVSLMIILSLVLTSLASNMERPPIQVGLALRSDSIVLVQLGDQKTINYTICRGADQEYKGFMDMMRHDQKTVSYHQEFIMLQQEYDAFHQKFRPIRNHTVTQPVLPVTNFHYTHIIARNIRPLVKEAAIELGADVKCDIIMIPSYGNKAYNFRPFIRFASELAGCGSVGYAQIQGLPRAPLWAYDLDTTDGLQREPGPHRHIERESLLVGIESNHIRLSLINVDAKHVAQRCVCSCDRQGLSIADTLATCAVRFKEDCLAYDEAYNPRRRLRRADYRVPKRVFVSGSPELHEASIQGVIVEQFGDNILNEMSFGIDPEILGAYGAACLARISGEFPSILRDLETWNEPVFSDSM